MANFVDCAAYKTVTKGNEIITYTDPLATKLLCGDESGNGDESGSGSGSSGIVLSGNADLSTKLEEIGNENVSEEKARFEQNEVENIIRNILKAVLEKNEETAKNFIKTGTIQNSEVQTIITNSKGPIIGLIMKAISKKNNDENTPTDMAVNSTIRLYVNKFMNNKLKKEGFILILGRLLKQFTEQIKDLVPLVLGAIFDQQPFTIGKTEFEVNKNDLDNIILTSNSENGGEDKGEDSDKKLKGGMKGNGDNEEGREPTTEVGPADPKDAAATEEKVDENNTEEKNDTDNTKEKNNTDNTDKAEKVDENNTDEKKTDEKNEKKSITITIDTGKLQYCINHIIEKDFLDIVKMVINSWVSDENNKFIVKKAHIGKGPAIGEWKEETDASTEKPTENPTDTTTDAAENPATDADKTQPPPPSRNPAVAPPQTPPQPPGTGGGKKRRKTRKKSSSTRRRKSNRKSRKKRKQTKRKNSKKQTKRKN